MEIVPLETKKNEKEDSLFFLRNEDEDFEKQTSYSTPCENKMEN